MSRINEMGWLAVLVTVLASTAGARDRVFPNLEPAFANEAVDPDKVFVNGFETFTLTIDNYIAWCSISIDGGAPSSAAVISKSFPDGTIVSLAGTPVADIFVWGYWTGTDAGGVDTNPTTEVTMSADRNVFACCPFKPPASQTCP